MDGPIKLLIVDDSMVIRHSIEKNLTDFPIEVVGHAADGKAALELFRDTHPDAVTLDFTMPGLDGLTVLEEMRRADPDARVMVVTALKDKATGLKAIQLGARGYIVKPFTAEKLQSAFDRMMKPH